MASIERPADKTTQRERVLLREVFGLGSRLLLHLEKARAHSCCSSWLPITIMSLPSDPMIAFIGLGNMGKFMALNLARYLTENNKSLLRVWNRTSSKSKDVVEQGGKEAKMIAVDTLEEIATTCNVVITSLANDAVVQEVYDQLLGTLENGTDTKGRRIIFVETSTVYPTVTSESFLQRLLTFFHCILTRPLCSLQPSYTREPVLSKVAPSLPVSLFLA
jgi:hypothetical protein